MDSIIIKKGDSYILNQTLDGRIINYSRGNDQVISFKCKSDKLKIGSHYYFQITKGINIIQADNFILEKIDGYYCTFVGSTYTINTIKHS